MSNTELCVELGVACSFSIQGFNEREEVCKRLPVQMSDSLRKVFWQLLGFRDVLSMTEDRRKFSLLGYEHLFYLLL